LNIPTRMSHVIDKAVRGHEAWKDRQRLPVL